MSFSPKSLRTRQLSVLALSATLTAAAGIGISAPAQAASGYTITGVVTGLDATGKSVPLTGAYLYASPVSSTDFRNIHGSVDASGRFTMDVGTPGDYTLYAACNAPCSDTYATKYFTAADGVNTTIKVSTTTPVTANIQMPRWATVKGKVTNNAGVALAGIEVSSAPAVGSNYAQTKTDAAGNYTLTKVMPGRTLIATYDTSAARTWQAEYWNGTATSTPTYPTTAPIVAAGPTVTTANFQLDPQLAMIGQAVNSAGTPLAGIGYNFLTYNPATGVWDPPQKGPLMTDAKGQFFERTTLGGKYKVCFSDPRYVTKCWDNTTSFANATIYTQASSPAQRTLRVVLAPAPVLTAPTPTLAGTAAVGKDLFVLAGEWGPAPVNLTYQWFSGGVAIAGATDNKVRLTSAQLGKTITARVTGTKTGYPTTSRMSAASAPVLQTLTASVPTISGTTKVGSRLTAAVGTWGPAPVALTYQWYRSKPNVYPAVAIRGATGTTYVPTSADVGYNLSIRVTGTKSGYVTEGRTSARTATIAP